SPTTLGVDPLRTQLPENEEQPIHLLYGFLYVADKQEGLVIVGDPNLKSSSPGIGTLLDGNPANNFLKRAATFNPDGALTAGRPPTPLTPRTRPPSASPSPAPTPTSLPIARLWS